MTWPGRGVRGVGGLRLLRAVFLGLVCCTALSTLLLSMHLTSQRPHTEPPIGPQYTYITVDTSDGRRLGNVIFSYASMLGIARTNNMTALMARSFSLSSVFSLTCHLTDNLDSALGLHVVHEEYGRRGSAYDFTTRHLPPASTMLRGYYQSWKYFEGQEDYIRTSLVFRDHLLSTAHQFLAGVTAAGKDAVFVGVHIRRGDILQDYYKNYGYVTPPADYYTTAMKFMETKFSHVYFVVCSDDIPWAKQNVRGENVVYSERHSEAQDLCILSQCNHTIVSVGSFGWWGGFLAGGTTIYYDKWPREYSRLEYHVDKRMYFPTDWIPMH